MAAVNRDLQALQQRRAMQDKAAKRQMILAAIAAQQGAGRRGVSIGPVAAQRVQQQGSKTEQAETKWAARAAAFKEAGGGGGGGGDDGGGLFGNSIVKGLLTPLQMTMNVLDAPRRTVISGINELADAVNGGDASWQDFGSQVMDESFGFGDVVGETGNKWLDRGIGFIGDVALDPMTYVTLGSSKFIGTAGRAALAGEAAAKGMAEDVVSNIARRGESVLSAVEREALGLDKAGLRFGTAGHNIRIPGTEGLSQALGKGVGAVRAPFTDTAVGRGARRFGGSRVQATREFTERLATGKGSVTALDAANTLAGSARQSAAEGMLKGRFKRVATKDARELSGRGDLARAMERGVKNAETDRIGKITKRVLDAQRKAGVAVSQRKDYVPHYLTDDFMDFLGKAGDSGGLLESKLGSGTGRLDARVLKPNADLTINGVKIHLDAADIDDIEAKFSAAFPELAGKRLIEDDPGVWIPRLVLDAAHDVGERKFERTLRAGGSIFDANDPSVVQTVLDPKATKAANKKIAGEQAEAVKPLIAQREVMADTVKRNMGQAQEGVVDVRQAMLDRATQLQGQANQELGQHTFVADAARAHMDELATTGEAELDRIKSQIDALDQEAARLKAEVTRQRGKMNRARLAGYRERMNAIRTERAELARRATLGQLASQERDPVRKQLGRAVEGQRELAAQVGEGPLGAGRLAEGQTLPQMAEKRYAANAIDTQERQGEALQALEAAIAARKDPEVLAQRASELAGGPVKTRDELTREVQRLGGATPERREARVAEAIDEGVTRKHSKALTPNDRRAARRQLKRAELAEPDILSDAVTSVAPRDINQAFIDTQVALRDKLRPYRKSNLSDDAPEAFKGAAVMTPEGNARRVELTNEIELQERGIQKATHARDNGLEDPAKMDRFITEFRNKRKKLMKERDRLWVTESPIKVSAMSDMNIVELEERAARLADFMVRYANGYAKGGADEPTAARAAMQALETERKELMSQLDSRLTAEARPAGTVEAEKVAKFGDEASLDAEVNRRWDLEQKARATADEDVLNKGIRTEAAQKEMLASEKAKPVRAKKAVEAAQEDSRAARIELTKARKRLANAKANGRPLAKYTDAVKDAQAEYKKLAELVDTRARELDDATKEWRRFQREVGRGKPVELPEQAARETEEAFKARARAELANVTEEARPTAAPLGELGAREEVDLLPGTGGNTDVEVTKAAPQPTGVQRSDRDVAAAFELEQQMTEVIKPARQAAAELKAFQDAVKRGEEVGGRGLRAVGDVSMEDFDVNELAFGGRAGQGVARNASARGVESQLKARVMEEQQAFASTMSALFGRRMKYEEAVRYIKKGPDLQRRLEDALGSMSIEARAKFDDFLRQKSMGEQRKVRDLTERATRMGAGTGGGEVTDDPYFALLESAASMKNPDTRMPPRDLSQLAPPDALASVEAQRAALKQADQSLSEGVRQAQGDVIPGNPMDVAVAQQRSLNNEQALIGGTNRTARTAGSRRVGELAENNTALRAEELAGRGARDELRARGSVDEEAARRLEAELAPHRAGIEATQEAASDVGEAGSALNRAYQQVDQKVQSDLSATTAAYNAARGGQITSAVDVATTEKMVTQATDQLKNVKAFTPPKLSSKTRGRVPVTPATAYQQAVEQTMLALQHSAPDEVVNLLDSAARIAGDMVKVDSSLDVSNQIIKAARSNKFITMNKQVIAPGFIEFTSKTAGEKFVMRSELKRALDNMNSILWTEPNALWKAVDNYTRFFKAYATATPGFHVRNSFSATYMNAADGVSIEHMVGGTRIWTAWERFGAKEPDTWMKHVPAKFRAHAEGVVEAVYGSGAGGQFSAAEIGERAFGKRTGKLNRAVNENLWVKGSQRAGEYVEGAVRAGMALDSLRGAGWGGGVQSGSLAEAITRINRVHFNYSQVGEMDQAMRRIIPFWTFLSRNVPLQIQQMVTQPRSYLHYESFVRNFSDGEEQGDLPEYMRAAGGFRFSNTLGAMPQLGATQLQDSLEQLTSPSRMLAQTNPLVKAPLQVLSNYNAYYDTPYEDDDFQKLEGVNKLLQPLFAAAGQTKSIPGGGTAVPQAWADAARDLLPPVATISRLAGTGQDTAAPQSQALLNWLGIPVRQLTPEVLAAERRRRRGQRNGDAAEQERVRRALAKL